MRPKLSSATSDPIFLTANLGNNLTRGLVDTGANVTVISDKLWLKLKPTHKLIQSSAIAKTATSKSRIVGLFEADINTKHFKFTQYITIIENLNHDCLWGRDVLAKLNALNEIRRVVANESLTVSFLNNPNKLETLDETNNESSHEINVAKQIKKRNQTHSDTTETELPLVNGRKPWTPRVSTIAKRLSRYVQFNAPWPKRVHEKPAKRLQITSEDSEWLLDGNQLVLVPTKFLREMRLHSKDLVNVKQDDLQSLELINEDEWLTNKEEAMCELFAEQVVDLNAIDAVANQTDSNSLVQQHLSKELNALREATKKHGAQYREIEQLEQYLDERKFMFATNSSSLGCCTAVKHVIETENTKPIKIPPRRVPYSLHNELKKQIDELEAAGIIAKCYSPWSFPLVIVKKKDGAIRMCVDYRKLNEITIKDRYPLPRMDDLRDKFYGMNYFSTLDCAQGYYQIAMEENSKFKTAFSSPFGTYLFNRMSFGLCNAPATFQRAMEYILRDEIGKICYCYLDDIIIFSKTIEEHYDRLNTVFNKLHEYGINLKRSKCHFFKNEVSYLGHTISKRGILPSEAKIEAIANYHRPTTQRGVRAFLGLVTYEKDFIENFSDLASPLYELTGKNVQFKWNDRHQKAFDKLRKCLQSRPILAYPDFDKEFALFTDASEYGVGAVLRQHIDNEWRAIAYYSKHLNAAQRNYSVIEKEALAILVSTRHFQVYLYHKTFLLFTDHQSLKWLLSIKEPSARLARWIAELSSLDFTIKYKKGSENGSADGLSRIAEPSNALKSDEDEFQGPDPINFDEDVSIYALNIDPATLSLDQIAFDEDEYVRTGFSPLFANNWEELANPYDYKSAIVKRDVQPCANVAKATCQAHSITICPAQIDLDEYETSLASRQLQDPILARVIEALKNQTNFEHEVEQCHLAHFCLEAETRRASPHRWSSLPHLQRRY